MAASTRVRYELARAQGLVAAMEASTAIDELERHWKEFLHAIERVWFKANACHKDNPSWVGWKGSYERERRTDPLLSYLRQARGAEEHTVADITARQPSGMTLQAGSTGSAVIHRFTLFQSGAVGFEGVGSVRVDFSAERVRLLPVTNRGAIWPVPLTHLGNPISATNVLDVARAGLQYYERFVDALEGRFGA